ncbi:MAG TPA: diguanylate cyclase, partial [Paracoccaceae bacterium]|nr:diguanylate cyclase [Paracoccaceae bacterium]
VGLCYFALASLTIASTRLGEGFAIMWIANAFLLAMLFFSPRSQWPYFCVLAGIGSFAATALFGFGWALAGPLVFLNLAESLIGASLLRWAKHRRGPIAAVRDMLSFVLIAGVAAPALTGLGAAALAVAIGDAPLPSFRDWCIGHSLGALTFTPIVAAVLRGRQALRSGRLDARALMDHAAGFAFVAAVTAITFLQDQRPLLFLPTLAIMLVTVRHLHLGGLGGVLILAIIGGTATLNAAGPVAETYGDTREAVQFLQLYLALTVVTLLPVAMDLARRRQLHRDLAASEERYRLLSENSSDIVLRLDRDGVIKYASPSVASIGYGTRDVLDRSATLFIHPEDRAFSAALHQRALENPDSSHVGEYRAVMIDGSLCWVEIHSRAIRDGGGKVTGMVSTLRDVSIRRQLEEKLTQEATTDYLTGLANRRVFELALEELFSGPGGAKAGAIALIDLDHFKGINDRYGHPVGDDVLTLFADRMRRVVGGAGLAARLGGEEFGILLPAADAEEAAAVCEALRQAVADGSLETSLNLDIRVTHSTGIAGLAAVPSARAALRNADKALYSAKQAGRNRVERFA